MARRVAVDLTVLRESRDLRLLIPALAAFDSHARAGTTAGGHGG